MVTSSKCISLTLGRLGCVAGTFNESRMINIVCVYKQGKSKCDSVFAIIQHHPIHADNKIFQSMLHQLIDAWYS